MSHDIPIHFRLRDGQDSSNRFQMIAGNRVIHGFENSEYDCFPLRDLLHQTIDQRWLVAVLESCLAHRDHGEFFVDFELDVSIFVGARMNNHTPVYVTDTRLYRVNRPGCLPVGGILVGDIDFFGICVNHKLVVIVFRHRHPGRHTRFAQEVILLVLFDFFVQRLCQWVVQTINVQIHALEFLGLFLGFGLPTTAASQLF
mmetsp:Transcript_23253/g.54847  ORF Transcript_23253/g.54847 Transcript_23253/m.54847 type:complete len:200 (+) Transcript_23253:159-758(+)